MNLDNLVKRGYLFRVTVNRRPHFYTKLVKEFKKEYPDGILRRNTKDHRCAIREKQPKVAKSIDNLVNKYVGSEDEKAYHKRFDRR